MRIISGAARNVELLTLPGLEIRPTSVRARKALFDSLGDFSGLRVLDLCSGSGAVALEAASRGAAAVFAVEEKREHCRIIGENIEKVRKTGVSCEIQVLNQDACSPELYASVAPVDLIFADPPYERSGELFRALLKKERFYAVFAGALLIWELPDFPGAAGAFVAPPHLTDWTIRKLGSGRFLTGKVTL